MGSCSVLGVKVEVKDVSNVLRIPSEGTSIPKSISDAEKAAFKAKFHKKSLGQLEKDIKSSEMAPGIFKETFMLYVLGHFLCPNVKDQPSQDLHISILLNNGN